MSTIPDCPIRSRDKSSPPPRQEAWSDNLDDLPPSSSPSIAIAAVTTWIDAGQPDRCQAASVLATFRAPEGCHFKGVVVTRPDAVRQAEIHGGSDVGVCDRAAAP